MSTLAELQAFVLQLQETKTYFRLTSEREGAVMFNIAVPTGRWEVEFFADREPEIEIFESNGEIFGPEKLEELWELAK